jgi:hypothetical protein
MSSPSNTNYLGTPSALPDVDGLHASAAINASSTLPPPASSTIPAVGGSALSPPASQSIPSVNPTASGFLAAARPAPAAPHHERHEAAPAATPTAAVKRAVASPTESKDRWKPKKVLQELKDWGYSLPRGLTVEQLAVDTIVLIASRE